MIIFLYTHTYCPNLNVQAGPDGMAVPEADSRRQAKLRTQRKSQLKLPEEEADIVTKATTLKSLLSHVKVNSIADYYDIPELRRCASTEIQKILNTGSWSPRDFPVIAREVFNSTGDKELYDILSEVTAARIDEIIGLGEDIAPPEVISDFANGVLRKLVVRLKDLDPSCMRPKGSWPRAKQASKKGKGETTNGG